MAKVEAPYTAYFDRFCAALRSSGALLVSLDEKGRPNAMTIGWGLLGITWGLPVCAVFVRPSRYTWSCIEATGDFTVNLPTPALAEQVQFCGATSGRDYDKFRECGFTPTPGRQVKSPAIAECPLTLECEVVQRTDVVPEHFPQRIIAQAYPHGDFHRVYFGEILACYADEDAVWEG